MSDRDRDFREISRELIEANDFFRRVRHDFALRDETPAYDEHGRIECTCNLCWGENYASVRALATVATPGMSERELTLAGWRWMKEADESPWAWKRGRRP